MSRPLRIEYEGAVYHVTSRGNARADIYLSDADRESFLEVMKQVVDRFDWVCHAYCLMTNHYHLMIETPKGNLSQGMRHLNGVYTQRFNRSHKRVGHVFQGRYKAILVEKDAHLLALCRYIVRNPVAAGMVEEVGDWQWSSYRATSGAEAHSSFCHVGWVLEQFGGSRRNYIEYVVRASSDDAPFTGAESSQVLGSDKFREAVQKNIKGDLEVPRAQKYISRRKLEDLARGQAERGLWMSQAYREQGYTMTEIAVYAGVHYSLVSKVIKAWEKHNSIFKT
ncbi:MAG: transposase [Mariprofundaceae bacterium]